MIKEEIRNYFRGRYDKFYKQYLPHENKIQKAGKNEHKTNCPFHNDTNPSFYFNTDDGRYNCQGCKVGGDIFKFYAKINGLNVHKDFPKVIAGIYQDFGIDNGNGSHREPVAVYPYPDEMGTIRFEICRMPGQEKDFRARRPDGMGGYRWNTQGVELVPYNLPAVIKAQVVLISLG